MNLSPEQVWQDGSHGPHVPFCGTSGDGHEVLHWLRYNSRVGMQLVQLVVDTAHVAQLVSQGSQTLVAVLAMANPVGQVLTHAPLDKYLSLTHDVHTLAPLHARQGGTQAVHILLLEGSAYM